MALDPLADPPKLILNVEKITSIYGGWPRFHDAEVVGLVLDREGPTLVARILAFHVNRDETDTKGHFKLLGRYEIEFHFRQIDDLSIAGFNHQNVLSGIIFREQDGQMEVTMEGIFGSNVTFRCSGATVAGVVGCD